MENIIDKEVLQQDRQRLKMFKEQIKKIDNFNTYKEIRQRVNEYILKNNPSRDIIDNFNDFLKDCEGYYINK